MNEQTSELSREELLARYAIKSPEAPSEATRRSPFKFLDSYDIGDADIFFGRDSEIEELLGHFHSYGHVLIYGESGSGKSSLVQCGLRSRIPAADALFIPLRVHLTGLPTVCRQICEYAGHAVGETIEVSAESSLLDTLREVREIASRPVVLFLDQFEELFIFHDALARRRFADDLASIRQARLNVKVIIGVRQDYLAHLSELEETVEGLFDNRFWLRRMSRENAAQAVVKACHACDVGIDDAVASSVLHRLDPHGHGIELPYLQVVMDRLYRQALSSDSAHPLITAADVEKLGDIADILGSFLIEEVGKLPSPDTGRQILKAFVTREGTRRNLDREAVAQEAAGFGEAIAPEVLDAHLNQLSSVRILREIADSGTFELRHDALAATVASWISEVEKELIEVRDNLINRFKEYEARGEPDEALVDKSFLDYLAVYRKRLVPLLNDAQVQYLRRSEQRLRRAKVIRKVCIAGGVATALLALVAVWMYVHYRDVRLANEKVKVAVDAVTTMMEEIDELRDVPQADRVRSVLLDQALKILEKVDARDEIGRYEKASIQIEVAQVHRILGSGDHAATAEAAYSASIDQLQRLCSDFPDNPLYRQHLGLAHMWLGEHYREGKVNRPDDAREQYDRAIEIQTKLAALGDANQNQYRIDLARSLMNRGILQKDSEKFIEAMANYDEAERLLIESAAGELSSDLDEQRQVLLSKTHLNRGVLIKSQFGREEPPLIEVRKVKESYLAAIDELEHVIENRRLRKLPERLEYSLDLAKYHNNLANLLFQFDPDSRAEAVLHNTQAVAIGKPLNVGTRQVRIELAKFYNTKALSLMDNEQPEQAVIEWEKAVEVLETGLSEGEQDEGVRERIERYKKDVRDAKEAITP